MRIVSLLPSATEIICSLGLADRLVGMTHECDFPEEVRSLPRLTRSLIPSALSSAEIEAAVTAIQRDVHAIYDLDAALLASLEPDLVVTQSLCEVCAVPRSRVDEAVCSMPSAASVISLDPSGLSDILADIRRLGEAAGRTERADELVSTLQSRIKLVRERAASASSRPRVFCAEWLDPIFCAGHWLPEIVNLAGGEERLGRPSTDSVRLDWQRVRDYDPEVMVLMPCGFDAAGALVEARCMTGRPGWQDVSAVRSGRVFIVDANAYFVRAAPRLVDGLEILARLIHPELFTAPPPSGSVFKLAGGSFDRFEPFS